MASNVNGLKGRLSQIHSWLLIAPAVIPFAIWTTGFLMFTFWLSLQGYNLARPSRGFVGLENYYFLLTSPGLPRIILNTAQLILVPIALTLVLGLCAAMIYYDNFFGRSVARLLFIAPFFVMPVVSGLVWKNLFMHPVFGLVTWVTQLLGLPQIDCFTNWPLLSVIIIVTWEWTPFAMLIFLTSLQSLDREQIEAAQIDGAAGFARFYYIMLPHLKKSFAVIAMVETIFFLGIYAEIAVTTVGGPGLATTNLAFLIFVRAMMGFDAGGAAAGGVLLVFIAAIVTFGIAYLTRKQSSTAGGNA